MYHCILILLYCILIFIFEFFKILFWFLIFILISDFVFGLKNDTSMGIGLEKDTLLFDVDFWFFRLDFCLEMVDKSERMDYNIIKAK